MKQNLFSRDFTLVVIGQIISLFGNATIRFALPLYLLNQTGSSALYGTVMACAAVFGVCVGFYSATEKPQRAIPSELKETAVLVMNTENEGKGA